MPYVSNPPPPDRFVRRWLIVSATLAALMLLWQFLPAIEAWFAPRDGAPRTVIARGDLASDEKTTIDLFESARDSVVFISTTQRVRDLARIFHIPETSCADVIL